MIPIIIAIGLSIMLIERIIPDQKLPHVKGWWTRVILINVMQLGVIILGSYSWDIWLKKASLFSLSESVSPFAGGLISYLIITFVSYWWHRWRHDIEFLWKTFHQLHHSPQLIETITSFYKHPLEIICNSLIIGSINFLILGLSVKSAAYCILLSSISEYVYHMSIKTPHAMGYFFQHPEMHLIHHRRSKHYNNFSDLRIWDMLFGTFENPKNVDTACGFKPEREIKFKEMLLLKNVNDDYKENK